MIVVIAGIKRSGSTAQYNIVRIALQQAGYKVNIHGHDYEPRDVPEGEVDLVKRHPFSEEIAEKADHIFLTDRKDEDILASLDRMWGSGNPERLEDMRKHLNKWKEYSTSQIYPYYYLENDPLGFVRSITYDLALNVDYNKVLEEFQAIEPPEEKQDPVTLLFPNHISE